jgi:hypothetical protein
MGDQRLANLAAKSSDDIDDTRRKTGLLDKPAEFEGGGGGELTGFDDDGVARRDRRREFPTEEQER